MVRMKRLITKRDGENIELWLPIKTTIVKEKDGSELTKFKIVRENKLKGRKKLHGYTSKDYKEWGEMGGRPQKWTSEAERKRAERLRKKQEKFGEKVQLRGYGKGNKLGHK